MQDHAMQLQAQPFMKLVQANVDLFGKFSTSSEVTTQASSDASQFFQQATESAMKLFQSGAFTHLLQGMLKNYTDFLSEIGRSGAAMMKEGQTALTRQVQEATDSITDAASELRGKRGRHAE